MMTRSDSFERFMAEVDYRPDPTPTVAEIARDEWLDQCPMGRGLVPEDDTDPVEY